MEKKEKTDQLKKVEKVEENETEKTNTASKTETEKSEPSTEEVEHIDNVVEIQKAEKTKQLEKAHTPSKKSKKPKLSPEEAEAERSDKQIVDAIENPSTKVRIEMLGKLQMIDFLSDDTKPDVDLTNTLWRVTKRFKTKDPKGKRKTIQAGSYIKVGKNNLFTHQDGFHFKMQVEMLPMRAEPYGRLKDPNCKRKIKNVLKNNLFDPISYNIDNFDENHFIKNFEIPKDAFKARIHITNRIYETVSFRQDIRFLFLCVGAITRTDSNKYVQVTSVEIDPYRGQDLVWIKGRYVNVTGLIPNIQVK